LTQRGAIACAFAALTLLMAGSVAVAQTYPAKPIRMIVPVAPGGGSDTVARQLSERLGPILGQPVVVENRSGGGGVVGVGYVVNAPADGHTLTHVGAALVTTAAFHRDLPYSVEHDLEPVAMVAQIPLVLVVHPDVAARSVNDLIALAKAQPGKLNFASFNPGGASQLAGELLKYQTGINLVHVPYRGSSLALQDVLTGRVPMLFDAISTSLPHIESGGLRPLAVTSLQRSPVLPAVPTMQEAGLSGYYVAAWVAVFAPKGTARDVLDQLNGAINRVLSDTGMRRNLEQQGWQVMGGSREDLRQLVQAELAKWRTVVDKLGLKAE
jgi:tripartite-type tricarboxylate transporter receptor subunit TctC